MGGVKSINKADAGANASIIGGIMLIISLSFDGATGAYEDKLMGTEHVGPFDLM
jgi:UDP-galactose transporter B1